MAGDSGRHTSFPSPQPSLARGRGRLRPATLAAQALGWIEPTTRAVVPPIHVATTYQRDPDGLYRSGRGYSRADNPSYDQAEALIRELEGGAGAMLLSSGMAAATSVFLALKPGEHAVVPEVMYWGFRKWLREFAMPRGWQITFVPTGDLDALAKAVKPGKTKLVWLETPANPTWVVTDIAAAAEIAHRAGARLGVDSTTASPVLTRPIELGADLVMHSGTKYLNGHSDVMAGALVTAKLDAFWNELGNIRHDGGAILGPFEAWLLLRGMRTLHLRVLAASQSALRIAEHFHGHPKVVEVLYPGLRNRVGYTVAAKQMSGGFGGMLSIRVAGGVTAAVEVAARVEVFQRATSLGGVESLIEHRASIEGPDSPVPHDLLRLSVGIEDTDDLIEDFERALAEAIR
jgi:cystathionine gamma-synthase